MTISQNLILTFVLIALFSCNNPRTSEIEQIDNTKIPILLLGTYHFVNQELDVYNNEIDDYFTEKRQGELNELIQTLTKFEPTKILIEQNPNTQAKYDSLFSLYKTDKLELSTLENGQNEIYQLGFKLAKANNLDKVHCVDANGIYLGRYVNMVADSLEIEDYKQHVYDNSIISKKRNEFLLQHSILDNFRYGNSREEIIRLHSDFNNYKILIQDTNNKTLEMPYKEKVVEIEGQQYFLKGFDGENIGIETYVEWFRRNAKIYANILNATNENDRVLVIFGTSHIRPLQLFFNDNPKYKIEETLNYLK